MIRAGGLTITVAVALGLVPASAIAAGPTITTTAGKSNVSIFTSNLYDTAHVTSDGTAPATTGSVKFRLYGPDDSNCSGPIDYRSTAPVDGNGVATSGTTTPPVGGTYRWEADYLAADGSTVLASSPCNSPDESTLHIPVNSPCVSFPELCGPVSMMYTTAQPGPTAGLGAKLSDKAFVTVGFASGQSPANVGTVTFKLFGPDDPSCTGTPLYTDADKPVSSGIATSGEFTTAKAGTYRWVAHYSGGGGMPEANGACGDTDESTAVAKATPSLEHTVKDVATDNAWDDTETAGAKAYDSASLTGTAAGITPTGTVTYNLYPSGDCSGTPAPEQVTVTNVGSVPLSAATAALAAGAYSYKASYSGDPNYDSVDSTCAGFSVAETCEVPRIDKGTSKHVVTDRLEAAGCTLGAVVKKFSRTVKRGKLIKLRTKAGTRLPAQAKVDAVFSKGKRR